EGRIALAAAAVRKDKALPVRRAATLYDTPHSTLQGRLAGALPRAVSNATK
ncbi:hypothetical protein CC78DRAFT_604817, partial [Lojkania enalia]